MLKYFLDRDCEKLFGFNFSFLMKLAVMSDPELKKKAEITFDFMEDPIFKQTGNGKSNLIVYFSNNEELRKYIRLSYVGNYYFGFRISIMQFIKTFLTKEKNERDFSTNKYIYSYMMKNYFKNSYYSTGKHYYFESRYKDHRKTHDDLILIEKKRRDDLLNTMNGLLKNDLVGERNQYNLVKMFLKIKKAF